MVDVKSLPGPRLVPLPGTPSPGAAAGPVDPASIPDVTLADVERCLGRSKKAADAHARILRCQDGTSRPLTKADVESLLARAGVESTEVKTVLAYHARHTTAAFDATALAFLASLDFSDVASAHVDELKRQNQEQVQSHRQFMDQDREEHGRLRAETARQATSTTTEKKRLQQKSAFELEAEFAEQSAKAGLSDKEATLLLLHRKRFTHT
jgi:hypothetical protein